MKVAILGTGSVGITIAKGLVERGYSVVFGTRNPMGEKALAAVAAVGNGVTAQPHHLAAQQCDWAVLALPWSGLQSTLTLAGAENLSGKLVIDVVNPLDFSTGKPQLAIGHTDSAGEVAQRLLPESKVVKAMNTVGAAVMVSPSFPDGKPVMFIAGNDASAKAEVDRLLKSFGWTGGIDLGGIEASRYLEPMAMIWITYGLSHNHWTHAFALLSASPA